ncbi:MAG TPA: NADPH-dependent assimilatory sulfite reductase hemoprotein subunit [Longimicrobium sp.]|nr:NADPH-dependent assimilatory sulfite reductase hemoprotein subunit [Longimicrobium sp.]
MDTEVNGAALSKVEAIKEASRGLYGSLPEELRNDSSHLSEEAVQLIKFHGSYQQDQRDLRRERKKAGLEPAYSFMIRSKLPGGVMGPDQYLVHDELADRYGDGTLRVTTRQGFQLYGVLKGNLRGTIHELNRALVTTLGACGDVERNVLSCPAPIPGGFRAEALELARRLSDHLLPKTRAYHEIFVEGELVAGGPPVAVEDPIYGTTYLPRKFKTAIAFPDDNCTDIHANDLGFLAIAEDGKLAGYNVLVGGGMGSTHGKADTFPRLASPLGFATPEEVIDVATAVIVVQRDHGNRANRKRARLKYLIEDNGLEWFRARVEEQLGRPLTPPRDVRVTGVHDHLGWHDQGDGRWFYGLFIENGRISDEGPRRLRTALRTIVETLRPDVHLTPQQNLLFTNVPAARKAEVERILGAHGVHPERLSEARRWSMACPALPTCSLALAESERVLPSLVDQVEGMLTELGLSEERIAIRMTGCPNGCARPYTADLAFVGRNLGKYMVFVGGNPEGTRLNQELADLVPFERIIDTVRPLFVRWRDERLPAEGFGDFWTRVGLETALAEEVEVAD